MRDQGTEDQKDVSVSWSVVKEENWWAYQSRTARILFICLTNCSTN